MNVITQGETDLQKTREAEEKLEVREIREKFLQLILIRSLKCALISKSHVIWAMVFQKPIILKLHNNTNSGDK